jgi:hypothetical protein
MDDDKTEEELKLEDEFKALADKFDDEVGIQLEIAEKAIKEAVKISEKYGIPFHAQVSPLSQTYTPASFEEKFGDLDREFVSDVLSV